MAHHQHHHHQHHQHQHQHPVPPPLSLRPYPSPSVGPLVGPASPSLQQQQQQQHHPSGFGSVPPSPALVAHSPQLAAFFTSGGAASPGLMGPPPPTAATSGVSSSFVRSLPGSPVTATHAASATYAHPHHAQQQAYPPYQSFHSQQYQQQQQYRPMSSTSMSPATATVSTTTTTSTPTSPFPTFPPPTAATTATTGGAGSASPSGHQPQPISPRDYYPSPVLSHHQQHQHQQQQHLPSSSTTVGLSLPTPSASSVSSTPSTTASSPNVHRAFAAYSYAQHGDGSGGMLDDSPLPSAMSSDAGGADLAADRDREMSAPPSPAVNGGAVGAVSAVGTPVGHDGLRSVPGTPSEAARQLWAAAEQAQQQQQQQALMYGGGSTPTVPAGEAGSSSSPASFPHPTSMASPVGPPPIQQQQQQQVQQQQSVAAAFEASEGPRYLLTDFELLETLGTGTFGRVHLARLRGTSQYFAMKVLKKAEVVRLRQVEHINNEKAILSRIYHPFIVNLFCTFQDETNLYMLLEYVPGGELFSHLRRASRFANDVARFYAAEIVTAIEYMHRRDIIYRDLKPENLLLDARGHIKIADFGFAKVVEDRTWTLCGTPEYLAPEIIQGRGHCRAVDWWALGILIFEMLCGYPPFFDDTAYGIYEKILQGRIAFPAFVDPAAKDLIKRLLTADTSRRIGNLRAGADDIKQHAWFRGVDWDVVVARRVAAPLVPRTNGAGDTSNFENYPEPEPEAVVDRSDPYHYLFMSF